MVRSSACARWIVTPDRGGADDGEVMIPRTHGVANRAEIFWHPGVDAVNEGILDPAGITQWCMGHHPSGENDPTALA